MSLTLSHSKKTGRQKLNDIVMAKRLQEAISNIHVVLSYARNADKHPLFVQAPLNNALQNLECAQDDWDRGIDETKIE